ncbi:MAG TPA: type II toxin-antitoxin system HicB family antitoxin [Aggregatilineaceae bacterium]|nr:type II toxin-antitoxin system HicB family antitoxin [Anaerolineae bacterium]HMM29463.1 type II toxin-antitoxin system HicB family antitoxin [Aggregatilineaceae bacterium]
MRQVIITPAEEGGYYATVPSLPGCISQGETWEETIENIREAIELFIESMVAHGEPVPEDDLNRALIIVDAA